MRAFPLLLIVVASLVLAGCTKNDPPTTPTGNSTTTTTPTGNVTSPTGPTSPTGTPLQPKEVKSGTVDFAQNTPAQPLAAVTIAIDPGYTTVTLNVTFSCASAAPACLAANGVSVKAAGLTCSLADGPVQGVSVCTKSGQAAAGPAKVEFAGNGLVSARYQVLES